MSGNVWEWCRTRWHDEKEQQYPQPWKDDGREELNGDGSVWRVLRGGSYGNTYKDVRCAYRCGFFPGDWDLQLRISRRAVPVHL